MFFEDVPWESVQARRCFRISLPHGEIQIFNQTLPNQAFFWQSLNFTNDLKAAVGKWLRGSFEGLGGRDSNFT